MVKGPEESDKLIYAETKFVMLVVKNNFPFSISDEFSKIVSDMFPDSKLAKKYGARKTKLHKPQKERGEAIKKIQIVGLPAAKG